MSDAIGLFGGSFNPIHHGHLITTRAAAEAAGLSRILLLPTRQPPHKEGALLLDVDTRLELVRLAIEGDPLFEVSEFDARRKGPTYTVDTIAHFRETLGPDHRICWLIGADSLAELHTWYRVADLVASCDILTMVRPGFSQIDWQPLTELVGAAGVERLKSMILTTPAMDISSTAIRGRAAAGKSIRYYVPRAVEQAIKAKSLYTG